MNAPRIGSLFSGVGGLDMGVMAVLGGSVAWHVEFDPAPSKILKHHWLDVPNYGDVTKVDWASVEPVDVLTGGFPCQDVSLAGARKGMRDGTRSGLWSEFARAIDVLRPQLVLIENVRGLLSATAGDSKEWTDEEISDLESGQSSVGGAGGSDRPVLRALGAVLGDLAGLGYDAEWCGVRAADAGAPHGRFRVFIVAHPDGGGSGWRAEDSAAVEFDNAPVRSGERESAAYPAGARRGEGQDTRASRSDASARARCLESERGSGERAGLAADPEHVLRYGTGRAWDGWPEPANSDEPAPNADRPRRIEHGRAVTVRPEHATTEHGSATPDADTRSKRLGEHAGKSSAEEAGTRSGHVVDGVGGSRPDTNWGPYLPAIERWELVTGAPAPAPTNPDGKNGSHRLAAQFVEWMMGLPAGHVTDPVIGLTRNQQLKALGNGVVPQQAALALRYLLAQRVEVAA